MNKNQNRSAILEVLKPSTTGTVLYILIALILVLLQNLNHITWIYGVILVDVDILKNYLTPETNFINKVLGNGIIGDTALLAFWGSIGYLIYILLTSLVRNLKEIGSDVNLVDYLIPIRKDRRLHVLDLVEKRAFRLAVVILTIFYVDKLVFPLVFAKYTSWSIFSSLPFKGSLYTSVIGFVLMAVVFHGLVVLVRLMLLRKRAFASIAEET
jgi:hypothetical protein